MTDCYHDWENDQMGPREYTDYYKRDIYDRKCKKCGRVELAASEIRAERRRKIQREIDLHHELEQVRKEKGLV